MNQSIQAQPWVDTTVYPFKQHYLEVPDGNMQYEAKMQYVDEGEGDVVLFVHGTPTWSFLYRNFIRTFSQNYRCIALDHLGFGISDKPENFPGTPQAHAKNLSALIEKLDLQNITLVVHDFGGPIGLAAAIAQPQRIKQLVMFNTWLWETESNPDIKKVDKLINSMLGNFLYLRLNFSPRVLLKKGFSDKKKLPKKIHQQYIKPFPNKASRQSLLNLGKALRGSSDWYQQQWEKLSSIEQLPWLILWGTKDEFITTEHLTKWTQRLTHAEVKKFNCGHFVQEEKTAEAIAAMEKFLNR